MSGHPWFEDGSRELREELKGMIDDAMDYPVTPDPVLNHELVNRWGHEGGARYGR